MKGSPTGLEELDQPNCIAEHISLRLHLIWTSIGVPYGDYGRANLLKWLFLVVNLTISGMNYNPELEGSPVILIWRLGDTSF